MFRYCFFCLFLISSLNVSAATRTIVVPPGGITPTYGPGVGGDAFIDARDWNATVSDQPNSRVNVPVQHKKNYGWPKYKSALKAALKANPGKLLGSAAVSAAVAAVGWVMDPDNTSLQRNDYSPVGTSPGDFQWFVSSYGMTGTTPAEACAKFDDYVTYTSPDVVTLTRISSTRFDCKIANRLGAGSVTANIVLIGSTCPAGSQYSDIINGCAISTLVPVTDLDISGFSDSINDPGFAADSAPFIVDSVPGSFAYPDSDTFTGPDSINLPRTETTTLDNVSGSTTVTETIPTIKLDYDTGPLSITTTTTTVTNTYNDGVQTSTSTTTTTGPVVDSPSQGNELTMPEIPTDCEFMPTVCDFITWFKTPTDMPEPDLPTPEDQDFERTYSASFGGGCPAPRNISLNNFDSVSFSWEPLCTFAGYLRFLVIGGASLMAAYIGLGISRGNA